MNEKPRTIAAIAKDIRAEWPNPNYAAVPYLNAMMVIEAMDSYYGADGAEDIVLRFLGNARSFRGQRAKELKAELQRMLPK